MAVQGNIVLQATNTVISRNDPTAHAEMNLLRRAGREIPGETLARATLYTSTEPCLMCAGAIVQMRVNHVVYGCRAECIPDRPREHPTLSGRTILLASDPPIRVEGPCLEQEALNIHLESRWWLAGV